MTHGIPSEDEARAHFPHAENCSRKPRNDFPHWESIGQETDLDFPEYELADNFELTEIELLTVTGWGPQPMIEKWLCCKFCNKRQEISWYKPGTKKPRHPLTGSVE